MELITEQRNKPSFSGWYEQEVDYTDYFYRHKGKRFFIGGVAIRKDGTKPEKEKGDNMYLVMDYPDTIKEIKDRFKQLVKNNFKYFCLYCGRGFYGTPDKVTDVFKFIEWVKKEGYKFNEFYRVDYLPSLNCWEFGGNLDKYSCAFCFRIFDEDTARLIIKLTKDLKPLEETI